MPALLPMWLGSRPLSSLPSIQVHSFNKCSSSPSHALGAGGSVTHDTLPALGAGRGLDSTGRGREGLRINVK